MNGLRRLLRRWLRPRAEVARLTRQLATTRRELDQERQERKDAVGAWCDAERELAAMRELPDVRELDADVETLLREEISKLRAHVSHLQRDRELWFAAPDPGSRGEADHWRRRASYWHRRYLQQHATNVLLDDRLAAAEHRPVAEQYRIGAPAVTAPVGRLT